MCSSVQNASVPISIFPQQISRCPKIWTFRRRKKLVEEARLAVEEENYELAAKKYDEAIALCPRFNSIKRERNMAQKLLKPSNQLKAGDRKVKMINGVEFAFRRRPPGTCVNSARTCIEEIIPAGM